MSRVNQRLIACPVCELQFSPYGRQMYCGIKCREIAYDKKHEDARASSLRVPKSCRRCGGEYRTHRKGVSYCCKGCSDMHSYEQKKASGQRMKSDRVLARQREYNKLPHVMARRNERRNVLLIAKRKEPRFNLEKRVSEQLRAMLAGRKRGVTWASLVDFNIDDLKAHLERQFLPGMSWGNMDQWHIDHIIPKSSFRYDSPQDEGFKSAWRLSNLRPLWARENVAKGAKRLYLV